MYIKKNRTHLISCILQSLKSLLFKVCTNEILLMSIWKCKIWEKYWRLRVSLHIACWINHLTLNWAFSFCLFLCLFFSEIENMTITDEFLLLRPLTKNEECSLSSFPTSLGKTPRIYSYIKRISKLFLETFLAEYYLSDSIQRLNAKILSWDRILFKKEKIINYFGLTKACKWKHTVSRRASAC